MQRRIIYITGGARSGKSHYAQTLAESLSDHPIYLATAAVIAAEALAPGTKDCVLYGHVSDEGGHRMLLDYLGGEPILRLGMRLGEGTGAVVAYPIVRSAVAFLNEMASFDDRQLENCYEDNPDSIYRHGTEE